MNVRVLEPEEYVMLGQAPDRLIPDPHQSLAAVALDGERVVGRLLLVDLAHIECPWIEEQHRGGTLLKRMEAALVERLKTLGLRKVAVFAANATYENYLERQGYQRLPVTVYAKEI